MEISNITHLTSFILIGFPSTMILQNLIFAILLLIYLATLAGNILMIVIIISDCYLHTPMYILLVNLSVMEVCGISAVTPKLLSILIGDEITISYSGCHIQTLFYFTIITAVFLMLAVMSFDRYVAICHPLRYSTIIRHAVCMQLVGICLTLSFVCILFPVTLISTLTYCRRILNHFFCHIGAMVELLCEDVGFIKLYILIFSTFILVIPLIITTLSYVFIVHTVVRMPSDKGCMKTFSTCASHLTMVSIVYGCAIFIQIRPSRYYSMETDKFVNLVSTVLSPLLNPFIYTLRNQKVKDSIRNALWKEKTTIRLPSSSPHLAILNFFFIISKRGASYFLLIWLS
ncbi:unnamed protein product [Staurois parvus]|uniref:G-protein coupled receptors family 1 profile domain-containing protein n=1 Tax=Staurois parvus TaxID=386267 RepID=A0ABN9DD51_9NEOB|nr:unnamed protein product [Staurois parvus]